jgi:hypothetical protein
MLMMFLYDGGVEHPECGRQGLLGGSCKVEEVRRGIERDIVLGKAPLPSLFEVRLPWRMR